MYVGDKETATYIINLRRALKDAEAEIAKLNYIELPNEKVSNVFEAYLAWKSNAAALEAALKDAENKYFQLRKAVGQGMTDTLHDYEKQVVGLRDALEGNGDRNLLALFVLQDKLGDILPDLGLCSGLGLAIEIMRKALKETADA
jgi:hypothetical protein